MKCLKPKYFSNVKRISERCCVNPGFPVLLFAKFEYLKSPFSNIFKTQKLGKKIFFGLFSWKIIPISYQSVVKVKGYFHMF